MTARHKAIYGETGTGKTWLMKRFAKKLAKHKQRMIVWSGVGDLDFPSAAKKTDNIDVLEGLLANPKNYGSFVFIDEGMLLYRGGEFNLKKHPVINSLFNAGRHKGYTCYISSQMPTNIPPKVRMNCADVFCFRLGGRDAADLVYKDCGSMDFNGKPLRDEILKLNKLECFQIQKPNKISKVKL